MTAVLEETFNVPRDSLQDKALAALSERERAVAMKFAEGMTYREIGGALYIAPTTVRTHLSAIYKKLGIRSKTALVTLVATQRVEGATQRDQVDTAREPRPLLIAVLPFASHSAGEDWTRLADGLAADIMVDLARYPDLAVISRQTMLNYKGCCDDIRSIGRELNADYLLDGSLQTFRDRLRIRVQLVDARSGADLWAARYDKTTDDLFAAVDAVTENVVNVLAVYNGIFANLRRNRARRKRPASLDAYDCYLLGVDLKHRFTRESNSEAIRLLRRAVELDPALARAWCALGLAYSVDACNAFSDDPREVIQAWEACLDRALELDPGDSHARACRGDLKALQGDLEGAAEEHERALRSAPNDADTLALLAGSRALVAGDPLQGYALARHAISLNPRSPPWYFSMLGRASFVIGLYAEGVVALHQAPPTSPPTLLFLAMAHALLDEGREAQKIAQRLAREFPTFTAEGFIETYPVTNPPALAAIREGTRLAGLS